MDLKKGIIIPLLVCVLLFCGCAQKAPKLINGSFDGGIDGWTAKRYTEAGASVANVDGKALVEAAEENDVRLVQELDVTPNTVYRITCDVKTENVVGGAGANIGVYGVAVCSSPVLGTNDWQTIELVGKTAEGQTKLPLSVGVGSHGAVSSGKAWFDNVKIELSDSSSYVMLGTKTTANTGNTGVPTKFPTEGVLIASSVLTAFFFLILLWHRLAAKKPLKLKDEGGGVYAFLILLAAFIVRLILALIILDTTKLGGHKTDINCFTAWGSRILDSGAAHFYEGWCDYPPAYMLVLGGMAGLARLFGGSHEVLVICVKLPSIIADLACAYIIWRLSKKTMSKGAALALTAFIAFTPVAAYVSSAWGQIDQILALLLVLPILLLYRRRPVWAGLVYGLGVAVKPQALMCGPLFAAACLMYIILGDRFENPFAGRRTVKLLKIKKDTAGLRVIEILLAGAAALAAIFIIAIPFKGEQETFWLVKKYFDTATSYKYATVNAYNFWALIGANWKSVDTPFLGLTYGKWGTVFMALFVILGIGLYVIAALKHKGPKGALPLAMAYTLAGIFTFGHYMHERYVFPALMLIALAYVFYNDRRLIWAYFAYAATLLVNCIAAFYYSELFEYGLYWDERIIFWCSIANVIIFALFTVLTFVLIIGNKPKRAYNG